MWQAVGLGTLLMLAACATSGEVREGGPPGTLLGDFVDDYGIRYSITPEVWGQGRVTRYEIVEWDVEERVAIARNAETNPGDAGLFTRIDWVMLNDGGEYPWAFCYAVYDAPTPEAARAAPGTDRDEPRTGCGGYPFSRMQRANRD